MDRPTVQEVDFMGQVMEVTTPVQGSKAIKPDMVIKAIRVIREVITIRGINSSSNRVIKEIRSS